MLSDFSDSDMLLARDFFADDGSWRSWAVDAAFLLFCIGGISPNLVAMEQRVTEKSDERGGAISSKSARKEIIYATCLHKILQKQITSFEDKYTYVGRLPIPISSITTICTWNILKHSNAQKQCQIVTAYLPRVSTQQS